MESDNLEPDKIKEMRELCKARPVIYSDLDHLKRGSTLFLHEIGYTDEEVAQALDLEIQKVEQSIKGVGARIYHDKIKKFEDKLPERIGDTININVPGWDGDEGVHTEVIVRQCIPKEEMCGLVVEIKEDTDFKLPFVGFKRKGEEIVIPLDWYVP